MRRLHLQFYLAILATIAVFLVPSVILWHLNTTSRGDAWVEAASQFAGALLPVADGSERRQQVLEGIGRHLDTDLALYDVRGNSLAVFGHLPELPIGTLLTETGWVFTRGGPLWIIPFDDGRRLVMRPPHHRATPGIRAIVVLMSIALAFALGAYPIARRLTGRLARLQAGVKQLGEGNLGARVRVEGRDEVASLACSFNESASRIEALVGSHKMLLANCSHELRTPLARIRMGIERCSSGSDASVREELVRNIAELDALIGEMLLTSRLDALEAIERSEPVDLLALAAEEAAHFDREAEGEQVTVSGDPHLLRRLIRNLLDNAQRHAGGATRIRIEPAAAGHAQLIVEDHGNGVAEAERERIFEPFYRSSVPGASPRGAGLGLAIVHQIARAHGGNVCYSAPAAAGSRFVVTLPASIR
jgi:signal transduction histidine kinase